MKTIIAAVNFSPTSLNALNYAADMAAALKTRLLIIHIVEVAVSGINIPVTDIGLDELAHDAQVRVESLKTDLIERSNHKIEIGTEVRIGFLQSELVSVCHNIKPFILVIGSEQRTVTEVFFVGDGAIEATQVLDCAVLTVPLGCTFKKISRIGFACDLKNIYDLPINFLENLIQSFNASLDIIHVSRNMHEELRGFVSASLMKGNLKSLNPSVHFIINKNIEEGIKKFAWQNQEDLILVMHRKRSFFQSLFHKSESKSLELSIHQPVLNIPNHSLD